MHSTADYTVTTSIEKSAFLYASLIHWLMVTTKKILRLLPVGWQNYIFNINAKKCKYMVLSRKGWALNLMKSYSMEFLLKESPNSSTLASTFLLTRLGHHNSVQSARRQRGWSECLTEDFMPVLTFKPAYCYMSHMFDPILNICIDACQVWDPHLKKDIEALESVQKFSLRACTRQWDTPNLTLLNSFHLPKLTDRRQCVKLCTMYKIIHGLVDFPNSPTHFGSNAKTDGFKYAFFFHQRLLYGTLFLQIWCVGLTITSRNLVINMYCSFHV